VTLSGANHGDGSYSSRSTESRDLLQWAVGLQQAVLLFRLLTDRIIEKWKWSWENQLQRSAGKCRH